MIFSALPSLTRAAAYWGIAQFVIGSEQARRWVRQVVFALALVIGAAASIMLALIGAVTAFFLGVLGYGEAVKPLLIAAGCCAAVGIVVGIEGLRLLK